METVFTVIIVVAEVGVVRSIWTLGVAGMLELIATRAGKGLVDGTEHVLIVVSVLSTVISVGAVSSLAISHTVIV